MRPECYLYEERSLRMDLLNFSNEVSEYLISMHKFSELLNIYLEAYG